MFNTREPFNSSANSFTKEPGCQKSQPRLEFPDLWCERYEIMRNPIEISSSETRKASTNSAFGLRLSFFDPTGSAYTRFTVRLRSHTSFWLTPPKFILTIMIGSLRIHFRSSTSDSRSLRVATTPREQVRHASGLQTVPSGVRLPKRARTLRVLRKDKRHRPLVLTPG